MDPIPKMLRIYTIQILSTVTKSQFEEFFIFILLEIDTLRSETKLAAVNKNN
jgi:hypothetical protein